MAVDDTYTKSLLHFDGADASTDFIDESGRLWTQTVASSNAEIDTALYVFGGASGLFSGTTDGNIRTADHADFTVGSDDFTYELWIRPAADNATQYYILNKNGTAAASDAQIWIYKTTSKQIRGEIGANGTYYAAISTGTISDIAWYHVAVVRYGDTLKLYLNGVAGGVTSTPAGAVIDNANDLVIGGLNDGSQAWIGSVDEFRFSKGIARYTANFTPPTSPFGPRSGENPYFADGYSVY